MTHSATGDQEAVRRWCVAVLVGILPWFVSPGLTLPDTKLDLVVSPWRYLARSLDAWNTHTGVGELQNQAYGYLFPMGPFFGLGHSAGLPAWTIQRLWWTLLLVVAFVGAERLLRVLGVRAGWPVIAGALAYALAPRTLTVLSQISIEAWPAAVAPWLVLVLAPAIGPGATTAERRRAALWTTVLVASLGGVNATASVAALGLPAAYLLTASREGSARRTAPWWLGAVAVGSAWWIAPLIVLGRHAYPFMDFIESAATTTSVTSVANVLRGTDHWIAFILTSDGHPLWQAGWVLAQFVAGLVATCLLAALGLGGLARLRSHGSDHLARLAALLLAAGVVLMAIGHRGSATGPWVALVEDLLDGPLSPLRNVHKIDPWVRFPISLGVALLLRALAERVRALEPWRRFWVTPVVIVSILAVLAGATLPIWLGRVANPGAWGSLPAAWSGIARATDTDAQARGGTTLLLPASRFAVYDWGAPQDEPLSALATSPVLVRASAPLGHPGLTRLLDQIDLLAASGARQDFLAPALSRVGISRVVLRRDLADSTQAESATLVERTLRASPGFTLLHEEGSGRGRLSLYAVSSPASPSVVFADVVSVHGGPESLPTLLGAEIVDAATATTAAEGESPATVVTDSLRLRAFNAGRPGWLAHGDTTTPSDPQVGPSARPDLPPARTGVAQSVESLEGIVAVRASSSASDPFARAPLGAGHGPAVPLMGPDAGSWLTGEHEKEAWWQVDLSEPGDLDGTVVIPAAGPGVTRVRAVAAEVDGHRVGVRDDGEGRWTLAAPGVRGTHLRLELTAAFAADGHPVIGLDRVLVGGQELPGDHPVRSLSLRADTATQQVLVGVEAQARPIDGRPGDDVPNWWAREIRSAPISLRPQRVWLRPGGAALDSRLDGEVQITDAGRMDLDPAHRPGAALDDDPATAWIPAPGSADPAMTLTAASPMTSVALPTAGTAVTLVAALPDGRSVTLRSGEEAALPSATGTLGLTWFGVPAGGPVPDVRVTGATVPQISMVTIPCESAPTVQWRGHRTAWTATWTREDILAGATKEAHACPASGTVPDGASTQVADTGAAAIGAGAASTRTTGAETSRLVARGSDGIDIIQALLGTEPTGSPGRSEPEVAASASVSSPSSGQREITIGDAGDRPRVVALTEGANDGWHATTAAGHVLTPVTVDGWRAGFLLDPISPPGRVTIIFTPSAPYRLGILGGLTLAVLALLTLIGDLARRRGGTPIVHQVTVRTGGVHSSSDNSGDGIGGGRGPARALLPHAPLVLRVLLVLVGVAVAGAGGGTLAFLALLVPPRWRAALAVASFGLTGVALSLLGTAERFSAGAVTGQLGGTFSLVLVLAALLGLGAPTRSRAPRSGDRSGLQVPR